MSAPTDEEKMFAAAAHASGCAVGFFGPAVIWLIKKDQSPFVAYHAMQALIYHVVAMVAYVVISTVTCGFLFFILPLFWLPALWEAWRAYQGSAEGYPGLAQFGRPEQLEGS